MGPKHFTFRTLAEAKDLASHIASFFPDPPAAAYGLLELMVNAVEHGNLGITYQEKSLLLSQGLWQQEVERRLALPENQDKYAQLTFSELDNIFRINIKDQGPGFDWMMFMNPDPARLTDLNGRGIATARRISAFKLEYLGCGNEVSLSFHRPMPNGVMP